MRCRRGVVEAIVFWNTFGALAMLNGKRVYEYLPKMELKVHSLELASSIRICQNPSFMSMTLKMRFPCSFGAMSAKVGITKYSRLIALFKSRGSRQTCNCPLDFLHDNERVYPVGRFVATYENAVLDHLIEKLLKLWLYGQRNATRGVNNRLHSWSDSNMMLSRKFVSPGEKCPQILSAVQNRHRWTAYPS